QHAGDRIHRALGTGVYRASGRRDASDDGPDVDDAGAFAEVLDRRLGGEQQAEHVDVEVSVKVFFGNVFDRREPVDTRVIDEDIQATELLDRGLDDVLRGPCRGNVAVNCDCLAPGRHDFRDYFVRAGCAGGVIDDY